MISYNSTCRLFLAQAEAATTPAAVDIPFMLANLKAVAAIGGSIMAAGIILIGVLSCFGNVGMPSHAEHHQQQHATVEVRTGRGAHKSNVSRGQLQPCMLQQRGSTDSGLPRWMLCIRALPA